MDSTRTLHRLADLGAFRVDRAEKRPLESDPIHYRTNPSTPAYITQALWDGEGIAVWVGDRGFQLLDVDDPSVWVELQGACEAEGLDLQTLSACVQTQSGGYHLWLRCPSCRDGNRKLARSADKSVRIETRGVGGYALVPPTDGYEYLWGDLTDLPEASEDDWGALCAVARTFDQAEPQETRPAPKAKGGTPGMRPGDEWAQATSWRELVEQEGGSFVRTVRGREQFRRPGKTKGISASVCGSDGQLLKVWTSNWPPFEPDECLSKFGFLAKTRYNGDYAAAARALADNGYGERPAPAQRLADTGEVSDGGLPVVETNAVPLRDMSAASLAAIVAANGDSPSVFVRSGRLARVVTDERGQPTISPMDGPALRGILARCAEFVSTSGKRGQMVVLPPTAVVDDLLSIGFWPGIPPLAGIATGPTLKRKGGFRLSPGYEDGVWTVGEQKWTVGKMSAPDAARWILDECYGDFPFQSSADRAHALALMILPFVRYVIDGPTPLHLIDAPTMGTGKSLLAKAAMHPYIGRELPAMAAPEMEEEWRKKLTSSLIAGSPAVFIDNIGRTVRSDSFAGILTATEWRDRVLGGSTEVTLPVRCVWIGTSNNAQLNTDIARRSVWIRLDAQTERPWARDGFRHGDLMAWQADNRDETVTRLLAIVAAWDKAGRPEGKVRKLGSFEHWSGIIGGILEIAGIDGFLSNWETMFESTNAEEVAWRGFYLRWWEAYQGERRKVSEVWDLIEGDDLLLSTLGRAGTEQGQRTALGNQLRRRIGRVLAGLRIIRSGTDHSAAMYRMERVGEVCEVGEVSADPTAFSISSPTSFSKVPSLNLEGEVWEEREVAQPYTREYPETDTLYKEAGKPPQTPQPPPDAREGAPEGARETPAEYFRRRAKEQKEEGLA